MKESLLNAIDQSITLLDRNAASKELIMEVLRTAHEYIKLSTLPENKD